MALRVALRLTLRLSISTKIFLGFVVVLLAFGGATVYGAWALHTMGEQLRLVALGYSNLRIDLQDQLTLQANLQRRFLEPSTAPRSRKEITADWTRRLLRLQQAQGRVAELRRTLSKADARYLLGLAARLDRVEHLYEEGEPFFQQIYGGTGPGEAAPKGREAVDSGVAATELSAREEQAAQIVQSLSSELTNKVIDVVHEGGRYETRALWMTLLLSIGATGFGVLVMLLVQATLRPLRRLSDSAKEVARGNYRQRVFADSPDEVGALGREFNAMAAALQEREQRLRRSEQLAAVGKMAAQITHEVRNPLSSIGLNAELLADEVAGDNAEARTLAQAIVREVDRLADITEQYLRFARLPDPRFEREEISAVVKGLLSFLAEEFAAAGVSVQAELSAGLPAVQLDENQLRPALLNLLRNAKEAMADLPREQRLLLVRTRGFDSAQRRPFIERAQRSGAPFIERSEGAGGTHLIVAIDVIDRGPGIKQEHRGRIFEPFFTTKKGGTGLGLALAHEVVVRHGGALLVESPEGGGTRFTIELPASP